MAGPHYTFEALHPFHGGNGRLGQRRMIALVGVRDRLCDQIRDSALRSARAYDAVDVALAATTVGVVLRQG